MSKKNFLLLSLEDSKAKKIANVMNNKSCTKILDLLAQKDLTTSEIAKKLKLPISTVHYNIEQLLEAKLIDWENYHYSEKGKEVKHYTLANKYIIIAPKDEKEGFLEKLKGIFPAFGLSLLGALGIYFLGNYGTNDSASVEMMAKNNYIAEDMILDEKNMMAEAAPKVLEQNNLIYDTFSIWQEPAFWFLIGAIFALICILIWNKIKK